MMTTSLSNRIEFTEDLMLSSELLKVLNYTQAERLFIQLLDLDNLDQQIAQEPVLIEPFEAALTVALALAYTEAADDDARLFLHRILYRINRLNLFWYDDLQHYKNERSYYL